MKIAETIEDSPVGRVLEHCAAREQELRRRIDATAAAVVREMRLARFRRSARGKAVAKRKRSPRKCCCGRPCLRDRGCGQ